jgi:hypothetical protein
MPGSSMADYTILTTHYPFLLDQVSLLLFPHSPINLASDDLFNPIPKLDPYVQTFYINF